MLSGFLPPLACVFSSLQCHHWSLNQGFQELPVQLHQVHASCKFEKDPWTLDCGPAARAQTQCYFSQTDTWEVLLWSCSSVCSLMQIALVNNLLKLGLNELKLKFRERLTKKLYDQYLQ